MVFSIAQRKSPLFLALVCLVFALAAPIGAQKAAITIDGAWRFTEVEDAVTTEFRLNLLVKGANLNGDLTVQPVIAESLDGAAALGYFGSAGAPDVKVKVSGSYAADKGKVSFTGGATGAACSATLVYNAKNDTLTWTLQGGESSVPPKATLYRLNAANLNSAGMVAYGKKDYRSAVAQFYKAVAADPNHKLANYNLACGLALMYAYVSSPAADGDDITRDRSYYSARRALNQLENAISMDPKVPAKAAKDSDWNSLKGRVAFICMTQGLSVDKPAQLETILKSTTFYGRSLGTGPAPILTLKKGGAFIIRNVMNAEGEITEVTGMWMMDGNSVSIRALGSDPEILEFRYDSETGDYRLGPYYDSEDPDAGA